MVNFIKNNKNIEKVAQLTEGLDKRKGLVRTQVDSDVNKISEETYSRGLCYADVSCYGETQIREVNIK